MRDFLNCFLKSIMEIISSFVSSSKKATCLVGQINTWPGVIGIFVGKAKANLFFTIILLWISFDSQNTHFITLGVHPGSNRNLFLHRESCRAATLWTPYQTATGCLFIAYPNKFHLAKLERANRKNKTFILVSQTS